MNKTSRVPFADANFSRPAFSRGMSLVEVILALALFSLLVVIVISSQWSVGDLNTFNVQNIIAHNVGVAGVTDMFLNPNVLLVGETQTVVSGIQNKRRKENFSQCEDSFQSISDWVTGWGSTSTLVFSVLKGDIEMARKYGLDCGGHPKKFDSERFELNAQVELGGNVSSVDIFGNQIYIGLKSEESSAPDIVVMNLDEPDDIRSSTNTGEIVNKIDVAHGYVYVAQNSSTTQLAILDGQNSGMGLNLVATSSLPGVAGARPGAVSIFYFDSKIYIGTKRTAGREFHIFDVTEPSEPVWLGSLEVNHNINDIQVKDGFAFLATSGNIRDLIVLDVHDPAHIVQVSDVDLPGNEDGRTVHVNGNKIYLGRHQGASPSNHELFVFEFAIDENEDLNEIEISTLGSASTRSDITDIAVSAGTIFVTTNTPVGLQIFEFNKFDELVPLDDLPQLPSLPANGTAIDFEDETYVVSAENNLYFFKQE